MIKPGMVVFVRITHEPVYVLMIEGEVATCRRGVMAQSGAYYKREEFLLGELQEADPSRVTFEDIFKETPEGAAAIEPTDDSLLQ